MFIMKSIVLLGTLSILFACSKNSNNENDIHTIQTINNNARVYKTYNRNSSIITNIPLGSTFKYVDFDRYNTNSDGGMIGYRFENIKNKKITGWIKESDIQHVVSIFNFKVICGNDIFKVLNTNNNEILYEATYSELRDFSYTYNSNILVVSISDKMDAEPQFTVIIDIKKSKYIVDYKYEGFQSISPSGKYLLLASGTSAWWGYRIFSIKENEIVYQFASDICDGWVKDDLLRYRTTTNQSPTLPELTDDEKEQGYTFYHDILWNDGIVIIGSNYTKDLRGE